MPLSLPGFSSSPLLNPWASDGATWVMSASSPVLAVEPRAPPMPGERSTTELHPQLSMLFSPGLVVPLENDVCSIFGVPSLCSTGVRFCRWEKDEGELQELMHGGAARGTTESYRGFDWW